MVPSLTRDRAGHAFADLRLNSTIAREVAAAYLDGPSILSAMLVASYAALARESDTLFAAITSAGRPDPMRVMFTRCMAPYKNSNELIASVRSDRLLEVTVAASDRDRLHPVMDCSPGGTFDRFRAVHDILGHAWLNVGFDRHAEYATWRFQEQFHTRLARQALATELHAKHSVQWTTGDTPEHRAVLLGPRLVRRSRRADGHYDDPGTPQLKGVATSSHADSGVGARGGHASTHRSRVTRLWVESSDEQSDPYVDRVAP